MLKLMMKRAIAAMPMVAWVILGWGSGGARAAETDWISARAGQRFLVLPSATQLLAFDDPRYPQVDCARFESELEAFFTKNATQLENCRIEGSEKDPLCRYYLRRLETLRYASEGAGGQDRAGAHFYLQKTVQIKDASGAAANEARRMNLPKYRAAPAKFVYGERLTRLTVQSVPGARSWTDQILALKGAQVEPPQIVESEKLAFRLIGRESACDLKAGRIQVAGELAATAEVEAGDNVPAAFWSVRGALQEALDRRDLDSVQRVALSGFRLAEKMPAIRAFDGETAPEELLWDVLKILTRDESLVLKDYRTLEEFRDSELPAFSSPVNVRFSAQWGEVR